MTIQYIPRNMHAVFALLCFVVVIHWLIFPYPSGLLHWHCGNLTIAPVPAKQPWWIWINTSCEFIMNDCITTTKQSTTKPCAYFLGYTVWQHACMQAIYKLNGLQFLLHYLFLKKTENNVSEFILILNVYLQKWHYEKFYPNLSTKLYGKNYNSQIKNQWNRSHIHNVVPNSDNTSENDIFIYTYIIYIYNFAIGLSCFLFSRLLVAYYL